MKKKMYALLMVLVVLLSVSPINALAMEQLSSAQTAVTYTAGESYTVNIPAVVDCNVDPTIYITASNLNLDMGTELSVYIDGSKTYENGGNFYLYSGKGTPSEQKILCGLYANGSDLISGLDYRVAKYINGVDYNMVNPIQLRVPYDAPPGTYSGTIYFNIVLE